MIIGVDADDTLWINEEYYHETVREAAGLLEPWYSGEDMEKEMYRTEMSNLELFGYGAKGFLLSLIETSLRVTENRIDGRRIEQIIGLGKKLINRPVVLKEGAADALEKLVRMGHKLVLVTKGDLLDQRRKLERSGLSEFFDHVEVMRGKREQDYRDLMERLGIEPALFVMIGDSLKSDILPVLKLGGRAVYVPGGSTWEHEKVDEEITDSRYFTADTIEEAVSVIMDIDKKDAGGGGSETVVYTDGGCLGNPGPGGWAYIISSGSFEKRGSGNMDHTTNNRMELTAVIKALEFLRGDSSLSSSKIVIHTDSQYVKNGITSWIKNWRSNGWKTAAGKPVKNRELWMELGELAGSLNLQWKWVKGHAGDPMNEACDSMVRMEMEKVR